MDRLKYSRLKLKAIELRKKGLSYKQIGKELGAAKSTIRFWCINIPLKPDDRERLCTKQVLMITRGPNSQRERRKREITKIINEAKEEIQLPLSLETYRLIGAFLYWAEGCKTDRFAVTNSDPYFILFMVRWFKDVFGIPSQDLKVELNIYPQQNESEIKQFWSCLTGIPLENFGKSFIKPLSKNYKKNNLYYGTIRVRVPKGTDLRHRVFGWVKATLKDIELETELIQREWKSLKETPRPANIPEKIEF